jgi:hypothetical protein
VARNNNRNWVRTIGQTHRAACPWSPNPFCQFAVAQSRASHYVSEFRPNLLLKSCAFRANGNAIYTRQFTRKILFYALLHWQTRAAFHRPLLAVMQFQQPLHAFLAVGKVENA